MIGVPGGCVVCDKPIFDNGRPTEHFTQVDVTWDNGSTMAVGVCKDCATSHAHATESGKKLVTEWHRAFWDRTGGRYDKAAEIV